MLSNANEAQSRAIKAGGMGSHKAQSSNASSIQGGNAGLWQHPYVDVFKHFKVTPGADWKQNKKQGDVTEIFVSTSPALILIGKGDWAQSHEHPGKHLGKQLHPTASSAQSVEISGSQWSLPLSAGEISGRSPLQFAFRFQYARERPQRSHLCLKPV